MSSPCRRASSTSGARRRPRTSPPTRPCSPWRAWCTCRCSARRGCARRGRPAWPSPRTRRSGSRPRGRAAVPGTDNIQGVCRRRRTERDRRDPRRPGQGVYPGLPARARLPGARATRCSSRSPRSARPRRSTASSRRSPRPGAREADLREVAGRPARASRCPRPDLPGPGRSRPSSRAASRRACRSSPSPRCCATSPSSRRGTSGSTRASTRSARCTMKYNPRVNERLVGLPGLPRPPSARRGRRGAGRARARVGARRRSSAR